MKIKFKDDDNRNLFKAILGLVFWIVVLFLISKIIALFK